MKIRAGDQMALRPGRCYQKIHRPYTRQSKKKPKKGYIKGVPKPRISEFEMGRKGMYEKSLYLVSTKPAQIRHNALESARVSVVQVLEKSLGKEGFFFKVLIYPHNVLRENVLATGAGADRFQQGMRQAFGKPIGTAAIVKEGQKIMRIDLDESGIKIGKNAFKQANYKLPIPCKIIIEDVNKNVKNK